MRTTLTFIGILTISWGVAVAEGTPDCYKKVDQVLWVVSDLDKTIEKYSQLGFSQYTEFRDVEIEFKMTGTKETVRMAVANLGGAIVNWIQPPDNESLFGQFLETYGDGAMSLVHRFPGKEELNEETTRLQSLGIGILERITIQTEMGSLRFVLMNTRPEGKYVLGFTHGDSGLEIRRNLKDENRHNMKINQYAFAIRDPEPVSRFWAGIGLPEFQINHPVLGETRYYGELVDHQLIQGWQRHGTISYEWCIPVKPPIVYEDHILKHGEGIHHLAFTVHDMDEVLKDYTERGFVVSMGGTWGEKGKPGSGRYEYIDLEDAGGVTMELLWSYNE